MQNNGYALTASDMINEWILKFPRLGIATKRGLCDGSFIIWSERGLTVDGDKPILQAVLKELQKFVNIAYIIGPNKENLASVTMDQFGMLDVTEESGTLGSYYKSFIHY